MGEQMNKIYGLGLKKDGIDSRDHYYERLGLSIPQEYHLPDIGFIYDQGELGSCTAQAASTAFRYELKRQNIPDFSPSRLFLYYCERMLEGTTNSDSGASIRDSVKAMGRYGLCNEDLWPYDINEFAYKPAVECFIEAKRERALKYKRIPKYLSLMRECISAGFPFVFGIDVYSSFMDATNGVIPMPSISDSLLGGHALLAVGYSDLTGYFRVQNSWGDSWGNKGYCSIPYGYFMSPHASDMWQLLFVS